MNNINKTHGISTIIANVVLQTSDFRDTPSTNTRHTRMRTSAIARQFVQARFKYSRHSEIERCSQVSFPCGGRRGGEAEAKRRGRGLT